MATPQVKSQNGKEEEDGERVCGGKLHLFTRTWGLGICCRIWRPMVSEENDPGMLRSLPVVVVAVDA